MLAIVGTVGVPASYGGFETLVENLLDGGDDPVLVYCSGSHYFERREKYKNALLQYVNLKANGVQSILYDVLSIIGSIRSSASSILVLGVSGAVALPFVRLFSNARIVTNIDGLEWRRDKWSWPVKKFLKFSESLAVKSSHVIISDNQAIADYVFQEYGVESEVIPYGGDHVLVRAVEPRDDGYSFCVCRIEPENSVHLILEAYQVVGERLKFVGNWESSDYGRRLKKQYQGSKSIELIDPIYDLEILFDLRSKCSLYIHGHSAGGTNPSLVEAMHFGKPILAYDCSYNRATTEDSAYYFSDKASLVDILSSGLDVDACASVGREMAEIAARRYVWAVVKKQYKDICLC